MTALDPSRPAAPRTQRQPRRIPARWREWEPTVRAWAQPLGLTAQLPALQSEHAAWLSHLLTLRIEMRVVRRLALDDPRLPRTMLERRVADYRTRAAALARVRAPQPTRFDTRSQQNADQP